MTTLGERIRLIRKAGQPKLTQEEFAKSLGVTVPMIYTYEHNKVVPNDAFKMLLCRTYHVNNRWLESGEGEMFVEEPDFIHDLVEKSMASHDKRTRKIIERFLRLPPETRNQILGALETILADEEEDSQ